MLEGEQAPVIEKEPQLVQCLALILALNGRYIDRRNVEQPLVERTYSFVVRNPDQHAGLLCNFSDSVAVLFPDSLAGSGTVRETFECSRILPRRNFSRQ